MGMVARAGRAEREDGAGGGRGLLVVASVLR